MPSICSNTPHMSSMLLCASACSGGYLHVIGGCRGPPVWTPPCVWMPPQVSNTLHTFVCFPACLCSWGYLHVLWGKNPICWGSGGISTSVRLLVSVSTSLILDVHYASSCTFLVVHYFSSLYFHSYDYYFSSDSGVFWYVISIISYCGSLFDGASYNDGSA